MPSEIKSSLKSPEVEEAIDLWFYRPIGYQIARVCRALRLHPNTVTVFSGLLGALGGHLFYYTDFRLNLLGVLIFIAGNALDSADGQLARLTNTTTRWGRILDGVADTARFTSCYLHLALRLMYSSGHGALFLLVALGAASHRIQAALTEFYRTAYQNWTSQPTRAVDRAEKIESELAQMKRNRAPWPQRLLLKMYLPYLQQVEAYSPTARTLGRTIEQHYPHGAPAAFSDEYRRTNKPLMKFYGLISDNLRVLVMYVSVLLNQLLLLFLVEITIQNLVAWRILRAQRLNNEHIIRWVAQSAPDLQAG